MSDEEMKRKMEFVVEQQAQFRVDIQQLREGMQELRESQARTDQLINRLAAVTLEGFKDVNAKIDALVDSHVRLSDAHERLAESQAKTDEALKNLIAVADRYFRGRNGEAAE
jgi:hypothetical protein